MSWASWSGLGRSWVALSRIRLKKAGWGAALLDILARAYAHSWGGLGRVEGSSLELLKSRRGSKGRPKLSQDAPRTHGTSPDRTTWPQDYPKSTPQMIQN